MKALALIPARSGSQRVRNKNILPLAGHPLIAYSICSALESGVFSRVVVTTDSEEIGEVVIKGENVTAGYINNEEANATAFTDGWFRTGDQGRLDNEGYLTLTGRLKEIINRGGEKISPREVDEILLDHESVAQVVTFAMPHDKLGEDVAAAVVIEEGSTIDEAGLRKYAAQRLADFKVPRKIIFLEEIPKGATGKLQRIGLAKKLGLV